MISHSQAFGDRKKGISKQLGSFRYAVKNKKSEQVFGHQAMYGETDQSGSYFVQFSDGRILYVTYTADHRGYRPLLRSVSGISASGIICHMDGHYGKLGSGYYNGIGDTVV